MKPFDVAQSELNEQKRAHSERCSVGACHLLSEEELDAITGGKVDVADFTLPIVVGGLVLGKGVYDYAKDGYGAARQYLTSPKVHPEP